MPYELTFKENKKKQNCSFCQKQYKYNEIYANIAFIDQEGNIKHEQTFCIDISKSKQQNLISLKNNSIHRLIQEYNYLRV